MLDECDHLLDPATCADCLGLEPDDPDLERATAAFTSAYSGRCVGSDHDAGCGGRFDAGELVVGVREAGSWPLVGYAREECQP